MGKLKMTAKVVSQETLATDVFSLVLEAPEIASQAIAGQFVSVYTHDGSKMLPRPISLCGIDREAGTLRLVYRVVGFGTKEFSQLAAGDTVDILGPLGNGFMKSDKKAILIGGGIGIPPMLQLAKELDCEKSVVLGYRDEIFLNEEFEPYAQVYMSSEDGQHGEGQRNRCHKGIRRGRCCHICMWPYSYASGNQGIRHGEGHRVPDIHGGEDGVRRGRMSCLRMQDKGYR